MKIIKRDGRAVDYNREKIEIAIEKANKEVRQKEKASKEEIKEIIKYIEELGKKRMLVEDIQDIIEEKLMEMNKYALAKKYIVYRYRRALVRKQNTTDESILGIIRNENTIQTQEKSNTNILSAVQQRNYIAGEVSKDLTKRLLLPEKIVKAENEGILYFHNDDYFVQPIFNCCVVNISDMLDNGTVINGNLIESPKNFQEACAVMTQIIELVSCNQYGGQSIDLMHLGKYLRKSCEKIEKEMQKKYLGKIQKEILEEMIIEAQKEEIKLGVQIIQYQLNTIMEAHGKPVNVILLLHLEKNDKYINENAMIIEEILKQRYIGIKDENGEYRPIEFPELAYVLDEFNNLSGGHYDYLTKLAIKCSEKTKSVRYISANFLSIWKDENGNYKFEGRFNQGIVSINLPQIGIVADGDNDIFWKELNERLELCKEALMCRHYALIGTKSDVSPIHWQHGAISRLKKGEKIDKFLTNGYSTISLGYIGIYEVTKIMTGESHTTEKGHKFAMKVMNYLKNTVNRWKKETGLGFCLSGIMSKDLGEKMANMDKEKYGIIKDITDKGYYTDSYCVDKREKIDMFEKLRFESEFQCISSDGAVSYIDLDENKDKLENLIKFVYDNSLYIVLI